MMLVALMSACGSAAAADCPSWDLDRIERDAKAAPSCAAAYEVVAACVFGSTADTGPVTVVIDRCEGEFLARLKPSQVRNYERRLAACDRKYAGREGTMYVSMNMYCRLDVAVALAKRQARSGTGGAR